ncbi:VWA domain-containing protein (plasmid) [Psychrobium sp. nBUS_13]|uniref:VWA domain-containing protein n=1 Tax=Psychrobium sp. nBUS_13 TaxID=3395319 RepID=UPI003EBFB43B
MKNVRNSRKEQELLAKFSVLTRLMSKQSDVKIIISGNQPYTTGDLIVLPCGDFEDATYCELLEGVVDHEIGHIDESCWNVLKDFAGSPLSKSILNIIEDVRMERSRSRKYAGSRINFYKMISHLFKRGWFQPVTIEHSAPQCLTSYILFSGRFKYMDQDQFEERSIGAREVLVEKFDADFVQELDLILTQIPKCEDTKGAGVITEQILQLLDLDDLQESESKNNTHKQSTSPKGENIETSVQECLGATNDDVLEDLHEAIKTELSQIVKQCIADGTLSYSECDKYSISRQIIEQDISFIDVAQAKRRSGQVRNTLAKQLHSLNRKSVTHSRRGSNINAAKLGGIKAGNLCVFKNEMITRSPNTAISILIDRSYSMEELITETNTSSLALACAFEKLKGVKSEVLYYPFYQKYECEEQGTIYTFSIHCAKSFDEKTSAVKKYFNVQSEGDTPTGPAMQEALRNLALRKEPKKILFVITDGEANDEEHVRKEVANAQLLGIDVVPIVLKTCVSGFEEVGTTRVDDISQLHSVIKDAVKLKLL